MPIWHLKATDRISYVVAKCDHLKDKAEDMAKRQAAIAIPDEVVINKIYNIRGKKVMIDSDLAELYGVPTKRLNEQVKRNSKRFPGDFMFQLTADEKQWLIDNIPTLNKLKFSPNLPLAFTEHGAVMLASVLNSDRAIEVNIQIVRIYTKMRELILTHKDLLIEMEEIRKKIAGQDQRIDLVFDYLTQFITQQEDPKPRKQIGFKPKKK
jgi:hypothetical protein